MSSALQDSGQGGPEESAKGATKGTSSEERQGTLEMKLKGTPEETVLTELVPVPDPPVGFPSELTLSNPGMPCANFPQRRRYRKFFGNLIRFLFRPHFGGYVAFCRFLRPDIFTDPQELRRAFRGQDLAGDLRPNVGFMAELTAWKADHPPIILYGNHTSNFDVLTLETSFPEHVIWVAKEKLATTPVVGNICRDYQAIFLDRSINDMQALKQMLRVLKAGCILGIFPQAHRIPPEEALTTMPLPGTVKLAIKTGAILIPFYIDGTYKLFRKNRVIYGAPFCLNVPPGGRVTPEEADLLAATLMKRSFALGGLSWEGPNHKYKDLP